jgi:predicted transcriptional regulator
MASETGRMSVSLDPDKQKKLDTIAKDMDRSRNWIVSQAIDQYLELYDWQAEQIKNRLNEAESGRAKFYSSKEIDGLIDVFQTKSD